MLHITEYLLSIQTYTIMCIVCACRLRLHSTRKDRSGEKEAEGERRKTTTEKNDHVRIMESEINMYKQMCIQYILLIYIYVYTRWLVALIL